MKVSGLLSSGRPEADADAARAKGLTTVVAAKSTVTAVRLDVFQPPKPMLSILYVGDPDAGQTAGVSDLGSDDVLASGDGWSLEYVSADWPEDLPADAGGGAASAANGQQLVLSIQHGFALVRSQGAYGWPLIRSRAVAAGARGTTMLAPPRRRARRGGRAPGYFLDRAFLDFSTKVDVWTSDDEFQTRPAEKRTITSTRRYLDVTEGATTLSSTPSDIDDDPVIKAFVEQVLTLGKATGVTP